MSVQFVYRDACPLCAALAREAKREAAHLAAAAAALVRALEDEEGASERLRRTRR